MARITRQVLEQLRAAGDTSAYRQMEDGTYEVDAMDDRVGIDPNDAGSRANALTQLQTEVEAPQASNILNTMRALTNNGASPSVRDTEAPINRQAALVDAPTSLSEETDEAAVRKNLDRKALVEKYLKDKFFGQGVDDPAIVAEQDARQQKNLGVNLGRAFNSIGAGLAGVKADQSGFDNLQKQAGQGLEDIATRRKGLLDELTASNTQGDTIREMSLRDPNSPQSEAVRNMITRLYPNEFKDIDLSQITAADRDLVYKPIELKLAIEDRRASRRDVLDLKREAQASKQKQEAKLSDKQVETITDIDKSIDQVNAMEAAFNPDFVGPIRGRVPDLAVPGNEASFRAQVGQLTDAYRRLITGQGASAREIAILQSRIPSITDTPENFKSKLQTFRQISSDVKNRTLGNLQKQGKDVSNFQVQEAQAPSTDKVRVQLPDGRTGSIPRANLQEAIRRGAKPLE